MKAPTRTSLGTGFYTLLLGWLLVACNNPVPTMVDLSAVTALRVEVPSANLPIGAQERLSAIATQSNGHTVDVTSLAQWSLDSASASLATLSNTEGSEGVVSATSLGRVSVSASLSGTSKGTLSAAGTFTVTAAALQTIVITPPDLVIDGNETQALHAYGVFSDKSIQEVTGSLQWTISPSTVGTLSSAGSGGAETVTTLATGSAQITATDPKTGTSGVSNLTVSPAVLSSLSISGPGTVLLGNPMNQALQVTGTYNDGSTRDLTASVGWQSSDASVLNVLTYNGVDGWVQALKLGSATVTATLGAVSNTFALTIGCPGDSLADGIVGGIGTAASPYQICSPSGLAGIANHMSAHYVLLSDIEMSGTSFSPLGGQSAASGFTGVLDGGFHRIENLSISMPAQLLSAGLFTGLSDDAEIKDLGIENVSIGGGQGATGAIAGFYAPTSKTTGSHAAIHGCYVHGGSIVSGGDVGGLLGMVMMSAGADFLVIQDSYTQVSVQSTGAVVGGLVGSAMYSGNTTVQPIATSYSQGAVSAPTPFSAQYVYGGGLIGALEDSLANIATAVTVISSTDYFDFTTTTQPSGVGICPTYPDPGGPPGGTVCLTPFGGGLTDAQMQLQTSFTGFDFTGTWAMPQGGGYPVLRGF